MSNLTDTFNLKCPNCGQADRLQISITCQADLTAYGSDPSGGHEWNNASYCCCPECGHDATVADFTIKAEGGVA
jgi:sarcosine oxidase delta subunit